MYLLTWVCSLKHFLKFPESSKVEEYLEPFVLGTIILPHSYLGKVMALCQVY